MTTVKRMFKLQQIKNNLMWDVIQSLATILSNNRERIPRDVLSDSTEVLETFLKINERIDNIRRKNIDNFYGKIKNGLEDIYNMEVEKYEKEKEED